MSRPSAGADAGSAHWAAILGVLESALGTLREHHVPAFLVRKLYEQLFSFVNVQLFNQLLLRRECCSFSNGEYVKTGLAEVEIWAGSAGRTWVGDGWEALAHIRQAVTFLVIHQKHKKSLQEITTDLCPVLTVQQLYRISTMYWDDRWVTAYGVPGFRNGEMGGAQGARATEGKAHGSRAPKATSPAPALDDVNAASRGCPEVEGPCGVSNRPPGGPSPVHASMPAPLMPAPAPDTTRYGTETVSHEVLSRMKAMMVESAASAASHSFLLDEDSALPFTQDDVAAFMDDKVCGA